MRIDEDRVDAVTAMSQVRVLIADDEPIIRLDLRQMLGLEGGGDSAHREAAGEGGGGGGEGDDEGGGGGEYNPYLRAPSAGDVAALSQLLSEYEFDLAHQIVADIGVTQAVIGKGTQCLIIDALLLDS